jgi:hypothetical protein
MKKDAAGYPSLPLHYGLTNPGISRYLVSRLPYLKLRFLGGGEVAIPPCYPAVRSRPARRPSGKAARGVCSLTPRNQPA